MNVDSITGSSYAGQVSSGSSGKPVQAPPPPPPGPPPGEGGFVGAIGSALESLGVTDVAADDKESASSALGTFMQQLMTSLHEQGEAGETSAEGAGGPGRLAQDLKSLVSSLQGGSADSNSASSSLETSFSSLLDSLGADSSDSRAKLESFLQALADRLPQAGSSGNLINTTA